MKASLFALVVLSGLFTKALSHEPCLPLEEKVGLIQNKTFYFGGVTFLRSENITNRELNPLEIYHWDDATFINWRIIPEQVEKLEEKLGLPDGFHIAPVAIVENEEKWPYLSLSIKKVQVAGMDRMNPQIMQTVQCDWFVYVIKDDDEEPTLMIIESIYDFATVSPLGVIPQSTFSYTVTNSDVKLCIDTEDTKLHVHLKKESAVSCGLDDVFLAAFDRLYWTNGVYSILTSNGSLLRAKVQVAGRKALLEKSQWSEFIHPNPCHLLYFPETVEMGSEVWVNLEDPTLSLPPKERSSLIESKIGIYAARAFVEGILIQQLQYEPIVKFTVTQAAPAYFLNYRIMEEKREALAAAISLPDGFELAKVCFRENGPEDYILTLNVYAVEGIVQGLRAEWSVFVTEPGGSEQPFFMVIQASSSGAALDPVQLFQPVGAEVFTLEVVDGNVETMIIDGKTTFSASFPLPPQCGAFEQSEYCGMPDLSLITANDKIYWSNGVYDLGRWDGNAWRVEPFSVVDPSAVVIDDGTKWFEFVDPDPVEIVVFFENQDFHLSPWTNAEEIAVCGA